MRIASLVGLLILLATPPAASAADLNEATLALIKNATVLVKVTLQDGQQVTGSGFVMQTVKGVGYLATNAHVVPARFTEKVQVVLNSGQPKEAVVAATVLVSDTDRDLAILRIESQTLPAPLKLHSKEKVRETMGVFILGFPFGEALSFNSRNPAITVAQGSVSSIRNDEGGAVSAIQIDGGINPGNSGGPVVDKNGDLIGISVATVVGAHIGLAIPAAILEKMLTGRVVNSTVTQKETTSGQVNFSISVGLLDPMNAITKVSILIGTHEKTKNAKPEANNRFEKPATPGMREVVLERKGDSAVGTFMVRMPKEDADTPSHQIKCVYADGSQTFTWPVEIEVVRDEPAAGGIPGKDKKEKPAGDDDWLGADPKNKGQPEALVKAQASGKSLLQPAKTVVDAQCSPVELSGKELVALFWNHEANKLFAIEKVGKIRVISYPSFIEDQVIDLQTPIQSAGLCKSGLVIAVQQLQEIWLLPTATLSPTKRIPCAGISGMTAAQASDTVIVTARNGSSLSVLDMKAGKVMGQYTTQNFAKAKILKHPNGVVLSDFQMGKITPDGKFFFCVGFECLHRFQISGFDLTYLEMGPRIGSNPSQIVISADSNYVSLPSGGGNGAPEDHPQSGAYTTFVYKTGNIQRPVLAIPGGHYPRAMGFDKTAGLIYAQNFDNQLLTFNTRGIKEKEYVLSERGDETAQILPHPSGGRMLVRTENRVFWVVLPGNE